MSDPADTDLLAAEYVLGTLDAEERADVADRMIIDASLARAVEEWHDRLAPLTATVPSVVPPDTVYEGITARLFSPESARSETARSETVRSEIVGRSSPFRSSMAAASVPLRRLRRWQAAAGSFALLAASLLVWVVARDEMAPPEQPRFTAVLQRDAGSPAMVLDVDLPARRLTIRAVGAASPPGRAYELWIVDPAIGAPRSLGLVAPASGTQASLQGFDPAVITDATYAVTIEPAGGSPTGQPTTTPILSGRLAALTR